MPLFMGRKHSGRRMPMRSLLMKRTRSLGRYGTPAATWLWYVPGESHVFMEGIPSAKQTLGGDI